MGTTVSEIQAMLRQADATEFEAIERSLGSDQRKGVKAAIESARRRIAAQEAEQMRIKSLADFDRECLKAAKGKLLVGLDEVGRGAVAGPLAVGAVVLPENCLIGNLNDSKQLTPAQREDVAREVKEKALCWTVHYVEPGDIDRCGMSESLRSAFAGALGEIEVGGLMADVVLIDGNPLGIDEREMNVVKGDAKSASIAAASVIAKVERDALMCELDSTFPQYGFSHNKGYASAEHVDAIRKNGLSPVHRTTFCRSFMQESLF